MLSWSSEGAQQGKLIENGKEKSKGWKVQGGGLRCHIIALVSSVELPPLPVFDRIGSEVGVQEHRCGDPVVSSRLMSKSLDVLYAFKSKRTYSCA